MKNFKMENDLAELLNKALMFETMWGFKLKIEIDLEGMNQEMEEKKGRWYGKSVVETLLTPIQDAENKQSREIAEKLL